MKMTYDDFKPGKYYIDEGGSYCLVGTPSIQTLTKNLHWFPHHNVGAVIPDGFVRNMIGECDRDGNLLEVAPEPAVGQVWESDDEEYIIVSCTSPTGRLVYVAIDDDGDCCNVSLTAKGATIGLTYVRTLPEFEPDVPCSECERLASELNHLRQEHDYLERLVKELEDKMKAKENSRSLMQSQRDHMSQKLAELTGYTPKEVRDGVKLLALGIKDKPAVEDMR